MRITHDTRPCTPQGHSAYRGYDATVGKLLSLSPTGRLYTCLVCAKRFLAPASLEEHQRVKHSGDAA